MSNSSAAGQGATARFVTGSIMRHVVIMTLTGAIGLMALFLVDLVDLFFLSLLDRTEITAAIGFAGTVAFANLSLSIGLGIAAGAHVARNLGAGDTETARRFATNSVVVTLAISVALSAAIALFSDEVLGLLGATGAALEFAKLYLLTLVGGFPLLAGAIACNFCLRALGDARRAMYATLSVAIVNAVLDPILIFGAGLGIQGAAIASVCANIVSFAIAFYGLHAVHRFLAPLGIGKLIKDLGAIFSIAGPAMLTQLATPFMIAYLTRVSSVYGDEVVAAVAIINRLVPVAFGVIFSLSGAVGPIIGQNFGAGQYDRVQRTLIDSLLFSAVYTLITSIILAFLRTQIPAWFLAKGETATLVTFFCTWLAFTLGICRWPVCRPGCLQQPGTSPLVDLFQLGQGNDRCDTIHSSRCMVGWRNGYSGRQRRWTCVVWRGICLRRLLAGQPDGATLV